MDKNGQRVALQNWNVTRPQDKTILSFSAPLQWPCKAVAGNLPRGVQCVRHSCVPSPHPTDLQTLQTLPPLPRPFASVRFDPLAWSSGVLTAPDQWLRDQVAACWAGFTSPVAMSCMCFVLLRCFSCSHTVLPKEHSWE